MEEHLPLVQSNAANAKDVWDFTFIRPISDIISDICDSIVSQIRVMVEFDLPSIF